MRTTFRKSLVELGMFGDLLICALSLLLASSLSSRPLWKLDTISLPHPTRTLLLGGLLLAFWRVSLITSRAYQSYRAIGFAPQALALAKGATLASFWVFWWFWLTSWKYSGTWGRALAQVTAFWALAFLGLIITRIFARALNSFVRRHGRNLRYVLIVGTNRRAVTLATRLTQSADFGFHIAGFVDNLWHDEEAPQTYKNMLLGSPEAFLHFLRTMQIDEVIIALPIASNYRLTQQIVDWCRQQGVPVRSEAIFDVSRSNLLDTGIPSELITHHEVLYPEYMVISKRILDVLISGLAIVLLIPLFIVIAIIIQISSPGPILFTQERLGLYKRPFRIWKFRTMVPDAEALMKKVEHLNETSGPTFKLTHDPRITKVGAFLRKTSLDELPQLSNVLFGHMSLVGPRPLPLRDYDGFTSDWHRRRFSVKPGITCLWQITGRSSIGFDRWMELDMDYIDRWSLRLDLEILLKTIPAVLRGSGAV